MKVPGSENSEISSFLRCPNCPLRKVSLGEYAPVEDSYFLAKFLEDMVAVKPTGSQILHPSLPVAVHLERRPVVRRRGVDLDDLAVLVRDFDRSTDELHLRGSQGLVLGEA